MTELEALEFDIIRLKAQNIKLKQKLYEAHQESRVQWFFYGMTAGVVIGAMIIYFIMGNINR